VTRLLASIGLPAIVAGVMVLALNAYLLTGGADFGGGVWDLLARGPRREAQRELVASAIGPIWEANHVWLVLVVVMLFTGFPAAFGLLGIVLHIPLSLMLVGIVLRGSSFVFRSYGGRGDGARRRWGRIFAVASLITPLLLGSIVGAIASGAAGAASGRLALLGRGATGGVSFADIYLAPWLAPFPLAVGALALAMFAFLAASYLAVATPDDALREDFRRRALASALAVFAAAVAGLLLARVHAPAVSAGLLAPGWALALQTATTVAAVTAIGALWTKRLRVARVAAAAQVSLILWGWVLVQYPFVVPPTMTLNDASAPRITLELLLVGLAGGFALLVPSLIYLYRTFAAAQLPDDAQHSIVPPLSATGGVRDKH
jgi:cytochrome d ubiquinol oxidase subunit II